MKNQASEKKLQAYFYLHFCVFVWGFTAILGKLISLQALSLVWWRVVLACSLLIFLIPRAQFRQIETKAKLRMLGVGAVIGLHWLCFYGAIKLSNASVAVATMATTSFFSALTAPFLLRKKIKWYEMGLGLAILPGMVLVVGGLDFSMRVGFAVGVLGALLAAVFTAFNKQIIERYAPPSLPMSFLELSGGILICSIAMPVFIPIFPDMQLMPESGDWIWLILLAWGCTLLPFYLTLQAMQHISAFAINLTLNLEPVYGVLLAVLIFREDKMLEPQFYIGVFIIIAAVFSHPFLHKYFEKPIKNA